MIPSSLAQRPQKVMAHTSQRFGLSASKQATDTAVRVLKANLSEVASSSLPIKSIPEAKYLLATTFTDLFPLFGAPKSLVTAVPLAFISGHLGRFIAKNLKPQDFTNPSPLVKHVHDASRLLRRNPALTDEMKLPNVINDWLETTFQAKPGNPHLASFFKHYIKGPISRWSKGALCNSEYLLRKQITHSVANAKSVGEAVKTVLWGSKQFMVYQKLAPAIGRTLKAVYDWLPGIIKMPIRWAIGVANTYGMSPFGEGVAGAMFPKHWNSEYRRIHRK